MKGHVVIDKFTVLVNKFTRKETGPLQPGDEDQVARPQVEIQQFLIGNPAQEALLGVDQLAFKFLHQEDESVPILLSIEHGKGQKTFE
jgi:hypothetical protein